MSEKTIILVRHAKSDWNNSSLLDHQRPLAQKGIHDAPLVASELKKLGYVPTLVLCSSATRAQETWNLMQPILEVDENKVEYKDEIYNSDYKGLANLLSQTNSNYSSVMLIGHNPILESLLEYLTGSFNSLSTANACIMTAIGDFANLCEHKQQWHLQQIIRPRDLK